MSLKLKKAFVCVIGLLLLLLSFLPSFSASADTATFNNEKLYYSPLSNATVTYNAPSTSNMSTYSHDMPTALGGIVDEGISNGNEPSARHYYVGNTARVHPTVLDYSIFRADGSGYTLFYNGVRDYDYNSLPIISYDLGFVLLSDVDALSTYQFEVYNNYYAVRLSFGVQSTTDSVVKYYGAYRALTAEFSAPNNYPLLPHYGSITENTYVRFNLAQLFSIGLYGDINANEYLYYNYTSLNGNLVDISLDLIPLRKLDLFDVRKVYNSLNLTKCRDYYTTRAIYNDMYVSSSNSVVTLFQPISTFLSIEFFPGFSFGYLLLIIIGISFFTLMVKILKSS